jgi:hypothetical protein
VLKTPGLFPLWPASNEAGAVNAVAPVLRQAKEYVSNPLLYVRERTEQEMPGSDNCRNFRTIPHSFMWKKRFESPPMPL